MLLTMKSDDGGGDDNDDDNFNFSLDSSIKMAHASLIALTDTTKAAGSNGVFCLFGLFVICAVK